MAKKSLPKKIKASRELQGRVGIGEIDKDKIDAAQKLMDATGVDFGPLAKPELDRLQQAIDKAKDGWDDPAEAMESFRTPIMNIKANAGSFSYKFISDLTAIVLTLLEGVEEPNRKIIQIVDVLHKTILLALAYQMKGDGGKNGQLLVGAFEDICNKYKKTAGR